MKCWSSTTFRRRLEEVQTVHTERPQEPCTLAVPLLGFSITCQSHQRLKRGIGPRGRIRCDKISLLPASWTKSADRREDCGRCRNCTAIRQPDPPCRSRLSNPSGVIFGRYRIAVKDDPLCLEAGREGGLNRCSYYEAP